MCLAACVFYVYPLHSSLTSHPWQLAGDGQAWFGTWSALGLNWSVSLFFPPISLCRHVIPVCLITQSDTLFFFFKCSPVWLTLHVPITQWDCEPCMEPVFVFGFVSFLVRLTVNVPSQYLLLKCNYLCMPCSNVTYDHDFSLKLLKKNSAIS